VDGAVVGLAVVGFEVVRVDVGSTEGFEVVGPSTGIIVKLGWFVVSSSDGCRVVIVSQRASDPARHSQPHRVLASQSLCVSRSKHLSAFLLSKSLAAQQPGAGVGEAHRSSASPVRHSQPPRRALFSHVAWSSTAHLLLPVELKQQPGSITSVQSASSPLRHSHPLRFANLSHLDLESVAQSASAP